MVYFFCDIKKIIRKRPIKFIEFNERGGWWYDLFDSHYGFRLKMNEEDLRADFKEMQLKMQNFYLNKIKEIMEQKDEG